MGENIDKFDEFPVICQYFPIKIFHLVSYLATARNNIIISVSVFFRKSQYITLHYLVTYKLNHTVSTILAMCLLCASEDNFIVSTIIYS